MLIRCPKCGFEQPQDRFCASCGVNIDTFKVETSLGKRIQSNSLFYVFLFILVASATVYFIYNRIQSRGIEPVLFTSKTISQPLQQQDEPVTATTQATAAMTPLPTAVPMATAVAPAAAAPVSARTAEATGPKLTLHLTEVSTEFLREIFDERYSKLDADSGVVSEFESRVRSSSAVNYLEMPSPVQFRSLDQPSLVFKGIRDQKLKEPMGLMITIMPLSMEEKTLNLRVEVKKTLKVPGSDSFESSTVTKEFTVPEGGAAYLYNILGHKKPAEADLPLYGDSFLKVLSSEKFQANASDFVLFIEVNSLPAQ